jgi:hypothetical protein
MNRTRFGMADNQHVGMHCVQRRRRVGQGLAFNHRARRRRHVDHVAAKPLAGDLGRGAGACLILEKTIDVCGRGAGHVSCRPAGKALQLR